MTKTYLDFRNAIGFKESSNRYEVVNSLGYLGRYQFGTARLSDFGLCARKPNTKGFLNEDFWWSAPFNQNNFLATPDLQDACFDTHVWRFQEWINVHYGASLGQTLNGVLFTMSGAVAICHLLGQGGLDAFAKGQIEKDANGVTSTDYLTQFGGYAPIAAEPQSTVSFFKGFLTPAVPASTAPTPTPVPTPVKPGFWATILAFLKKI